ncbi:hypothetical protein [Sphingopyxis sp. YF1]|uniref:hypothetical protein n=1 Tax=Sphingopyxis sp. YF1 TaxID=2482763 RepID=UPI001F5FFA9A|nr:hypothetical protein [Sphingopyxis sp. YF1]
MGGYGSGRQGGRPIADNALFVELSWMLRTGRAVDGEIRSGQLSWQRRGETFAWIGYQCDMTDPDAAMLTLDYRRTPSGGEPESVTQRIRLVSTQPHFGGRRWWMLCPYRGVRADKLYMPSGGDRFASRQAWRLGYQSQRETARDRPFSQLFALQKRLGCERGWEQPIRRPKGMWHRTYARLEERYWELDQRCAVEMIGSLARLRALGIAKP